MSENDNTVEHIHGNLVINWFELPKQAGYLPSRVVLVMLGNDRYVTAIQCRTSANGAWDNEWNWGHYFEMDNDSILKAALDYTKRFKEG